MRSSEGIRGDTRRGGFAVAATVLLLTVVAILGMTGYQLVSLKGQVERGLEETVRAQAIARAGMARYLADSVRSVGATVTYDLFDGQAVVAAKRLSVSGTTEHYLLTSTGSYTGWDGHSAERQFRQYVNRNMLMKRAAALSFLAGDIVVQSGDYVSGYDVATSGACATPVGAIGGLVTSRWAFLNTGGHLSGTPTSWGGSGSYASALSYLGLGWEAVKSNVELPADYTSVPSFSGLSSSTYPVIRITGDWDARSDNSGRGLLIVTGRIRFHTDFVWNGIILAGNFDVHGSEPFQVRGMFAAGMERGKATQADRVYLGGNASIRYDRCHVEATLAPLAPLIATTNTQWEVY